MDHPVAVNDRLSQLVVPIVLWAGHFLLCYAAAAVWCAKLPDEPFTALGLGVGAVTVGALASFGVVVRAALRRYREADPQAAGADTDHARRRFLAEATLASSGLGVLGVLYVALSFVLVGQCG